MKFLKFLKDFILSCILFVSMGLLTVLLSLLIAGAFKTQ